MTSRGLAACAGLFAAAAFAQHVGVPTDDLTKIGVDELFSVQVTSVGRKAQQISKAPAAVFVLTAEDIRRTGAVSLPEVLRWAPGLTVLSADDRSWLVSARGSDRLYSDKILVMIDGRSLYAPLFSGVIWDAVDVPLGDIERIEIVRGPGAVMWGPNAVNGVINIITRRAQQTQGVRASVATGNAVPASAQVRWGTGSDRLSYRVWGKLDYQTPGYGSPGLFYLNTFSAVDPSIRNLDTASGRLGFRLDYQPGEASQLMVQGDIYKRDRQDAVGIPAIQPNLYRGQAHTDYAGGYLQAKWTLAHGSGAETVLQFSYDKTQLDYPYLRGDLNNLTLDAQRRIQTGEHNEIYFGAGYQQYWDSTQSVMYVGFSPASSVIRTGDVVLRDEWQIVPSRWTASAGIRLDYNSFSRLEYQPSVRLLYTPNAHQSAWVAYSRAVRTPDRFDRGIQADNGYLLYGGIPIHQRMMGSDSFRSETERAAEAGYRLQSGQRWSVDTALFWSWYGRLRAVTAGTPTPVMDARGLSLDFPATVANAGAGRSFGGEVFATIQVRPGWRLMPSYSYAHDERWLPALSFPGQYNWDREPGDLRHQGLFRSEHDLARNWRLNLMARAHDRDRTFGLPGAVLFDVRLGWQATRGTEISLTCHNLANRQVLEAAAEGAEPSIPLRRTLLLQWTQRF